MVGAGVAGGLIVSFATVALAAALRPELAGATTLLVGDEARARIALAFGAWVTWALGLIVAFVVVRSLVLVWPEWDRLRRTRLLWTLTHAQFVGAVALACLVALATLAALVLADQPAFVDLGADPAAEMVLATPVSRFMLVALPMALAVALAGLAAAAVLVPLAALASFRSLRSATRRLEQLAAATTDFRFGALGTRVDIAGEDEVGSLQSGFNAMASNLEVAVGRLETERDTVARLLRNRRELVASISHELRTPVATLRAHLESALEHWNGAPPDTLRADLAVMEAEAAHLQRLIDDLFELARSEVDRLSLEVVPTDLGPLLMRCIDGLRPYAARERRIELAVDIAPNLPAAVVDPVRLDQVVRNLLVNAVRHSPPGGVVRVSAAAGSRKDVVVRVEDLGPGIEPDELPRIWDRFYRGRDTMKQEVSGAGLGLALVKELTGAMGGRVSATSEVGKGSCFTVHLPVALSAETRPATLPPNPDL